MALEGDIWEEEEGVPREGDGGEAIQEGASARHGIGLLRIRLHGNLPEKIKKVEGKRKLVGK